MEKERCGWSHQNEAMTRYHDEVWGVPIREDQQLFSKLMLDINQAGLSWNTILQKWDNFDQAYDHFEIAKVAAYPPEKVASLLQDPGIIRNRRKVAAAVNNAQRVLEIQQEWGSFSDYLWSFVDGKPVINHWASLTEVPATSPLSDQIAKDLKKRGFSFVGSTTIYAFLQAVGIINDHLVTCFRHDELVEETTQSK